MDEQLDGDRYPPKRDLGKYCPLSKVVRQAGTKLDEVWSVRS